MLIFHCKLTMCYEITAKRHSVVRQKENGKAGIQSLLLAHCDLSGTCSHLICQLSTSGDSLKYVPLGENPLPAFPSPTCSHGEVFPVVCNFLWLFVLCGPGSDLRLCYYCLCPHSSPTLKFSNPGFWHGLNKISHSPTYPYVCIDCDKCLMLTCQLLSQT